MKKNIFILIIILIVVGGIFSSLEESDMRIRVIANSNNYSDQSIKYEVVSIVKKNISPNDTKEKIIKKLPKLRSEIKKEHFPKKSLNGKLIPEGNYKALVIEIGEAKGKNWWTLLYPEYFNITYEDIESGDVEVKSYLLEKFKKMFK